MPYQYKLLQDYKTPFGSFLKGIIKSESEWRKVFPSLAEGDCSKQLEWFHPVKIKDDEERVQ